MSASFSIIFIFLYIIILNPFDKEMLLQNLLTKSWKYFLILKLLHCYLLLLILVKKMSLHVFQVIKSIKNIS